MNTVIPKLCWSCGIDLSAVKRVKDNAGNYYCPSCWAERCQRQEESELPVLPVFVAEKEGDAAAGRRERRPVVIIVSVGIIVGLFVVGSLIYFLFVRDWWEARDRQRFLTMKAHAEELVRSGQLNAAKETFSEAIRQFGGYQFRDSDVQQELRTIRSEATQLSTSIAARDAARDGAEAEFRVRLAAARKAKDEAREKYEQLSDLMQKLSEKEKAVDRGFGEDPEVLGIIDAFPEFERMFKRRNLSDEQLIQATLSALLAAGKVPYSSVKHVNNLFVQKHSFSQRRGEISEELDEVRIVADAPLPGRPVIADAQFAPKFGRDNPSKTPSEIKVKAGSGISPVTKTVGHEEKEQLEARRLEETYTQGLRYERGDGVPVNYDQAFHSYQAVAEGGNPDGMYSLAGMYITGRGTKVDTSESVKWLQRAAAKGHGPSLYGLAQATCDGTGTAKDAAAARKLFERALPILEAGANKKHPRSITCLGLLYRDGNSSRGRDPQKAKRLFEDAVEAGDRLGMLCLGDMYFVGDGIPKNEGKALAWYRGAADANSAEGALQAGMMYLQGQGTQPDLGQAVASLRKAIELESAPAMAILSGLYWQGQGVPRDEREAYRLAERAGSYNDPAGFYVLGVYHQQGVGVHADQQVAMQWFRRAAALGHEEAIKALAAAEKIPPQQRRVDEIKQAVR